MVDRLRRSIEGMEQPTCPNCHIEMKWYNSMMVRETPLTIIHYFSCSNCNRIAKTRSVLPREADIPPGKLSAPARRSRRAA